MIELLNLMESKGENYQSNRNLSIKLMNKKLKEERIKKRNRLITKAIAPKCKNKFVFDYDKDSSTWHIVFKGKVIGGKLLKNPKGFILIRTLLTNRKVPHTIESLNNIIQSDYDPDSTKETRFTKAEINSVASDKKYITRHKTIAGLKKLVTKLTEKLDDSTLTDEERENINVRLKKVYEELTVLEDNASIFKQQNDRVRKQIVDSLKTLNGFSTKLWKHLNASIKKGNGGWVYDPEKPIDWI